MTLKIAVGHNNASIASEFAVTPKVEKLIEYPTVFDAEGIAIAVGGGETTLIYTAIGKSEAVDLLQTLGLSQRTPSGKFTLVLDDMLGIPIAYNCILTLKLPKVASAESWWENLRLDVTGAIRA